MRTILLMMSFILWVTAVSGCGFVPGHGFVYHEAASIVIIHSDPSSNSVDDVGLSLDFVFDLDRNYAGFHAIPENYTPTQAVKDGCYVSQDLEEFGGAIAWEDFYDDSQKGLNACIRIMSIYGSDVLYQDLFFVDGYYRIFSFDGEELSDHSYKHLLDLRGRSPNADRDSRFIVLTDDEALTFEDVLWSMISSDMKKIQSISPYRWISGLALS